MGLELALTGDAVLTRAVSSCAHDRFTEVVETLRGADVSLSHLEATCHDYEEPEVYPAAIAGGTWLRAPPATGAELRWLGIDAVSHASNHALDYAYGGLRETWRALDDAGVAHAGTGENLAAARDPAVVETDAARLAVVSMAAAVPRWARAGEARRDMRGRPGVNALRTEYVVDPDRAATLRDLGEAFGLVVRETDDELVFQQPASRNAVRRFEIVEDGEPGRRITDRDRSGNLRAIEAATASADLVVAHVHTHDFRAGGRIDQPPRYVERFARDCGAAGADLVVCQGSHAPTRPIEVAGGTPILYDPGDFIITPDDVTRQPSDFYERYADRLDVPASEATLPEVIQARGEIRPWERGAVFDDEGPMVSPAGGFFTGPGSVVARVRFDDDLAPAEIVLDPIGWFSEPAARRGLPRAATGAQATEILEHLAEQSRAYDTAIDVEDGRGHITL